MSKSLIVYYSYTGNTREIAKMISDECGFDLLELQTVIPYSDDYDTVVEQAKDEVNSNYKPELKNIGIDLEKYDTIILGTPIWWYTYAPAINTFLSENNLDGKKIIPFMTNGGWLGHTLNDLKNNLPNSEVINPIDIKFDGNELLVDSDVIDSWIQSLRR